MLNSPEFHPKPLNIHQRFSKWSPITASPIPYQVLSYPFIAHHILKNKHTFVQKRMVITETAIKAEMKNVMNQATQCSQLSNPIIHIYSWRQGKSQVLESNHSS